MKIFLLSTPVMHLCLLVDKKTYIDFIECDSDIYKTSKPDMKPGEAILLTSNISVISSNLSDAIRAKLKVLLLQVAKTEITQMHKGTITNCLKIQTEKKTDIQMRFVWQKKTACFPRAAVCHMWQEKVGFSWTWGWAGSSQFPWLVSFLGCHRPCRKTCSTSLITSLQSCRFVVESAL